MFGLSLYMDIIFINLKYKFDLDYNKNILIL
jgi:hypothetical protein